MLERLLFERVGPSPSMSFELADRLNLLTGDNGLGKSFVLDAAWWALTRTWPGGRAILPDPAQEGPPRIGYHVHGVGGANKFVWCDFDYASSPPEWKIPRRRPPVPGLIIYARVDGGFSVWDPARNYWRQDNSAPVGTPDRPSAYHFDREQIWSGLWRTPKDQYEKNRDAIVCRGLLEDIVSWQLDPSEADTIALFRNILAAISPDPAQPYQLGPLSELLGRTGKLPTLITPEHSQPLLFDFASSGVRRILAISYALVWAWSEHCRALRLTRGQATQAQQIVLLLDEVENHLHPRWQLQIMPALLQALQGIQSDPRVQVVATTHSPLVLASLETEFDSATDRLFNLELKTRGIVEVEVVKWAKFGDAAGWLTSPAFDVHGGGYSRQAQIAMKAADDFMAGYLDELPPHLTGVEQIQQELSKTLDAADPYWTFWIPYYKRHAPK